MRIGIDFDDTLVDSFSIYKKYFDTWDEKDRFKDIYHMSHNDWNHFFDIYWNRIYKEVDFFKEVKECLDELKEMGHTLVLVSSRYGPCVEFAVNQIKKEELPISEFIFTDYFKSQACIDNNIDLMIDDNDNVISDLKNHHIKCLKKGNSRKYKHYDTWYDIVDYIKKEAK